MKYPLKLTILLLLLLGWSFAANAQADQPLNLLPALEPITAANASRLQPIAELGVDPINDVAWSPDGKTLAIAGSAGLWRYGVQAADSQPRLIEGYSGLFRSVAFSPDSKIIATGNDMGLIQLWDAQTWMKTTMLQKAAGHSVEKLVFSPDSRLLAVGYDDGTAQIWDLARGAVLKSWDDGEQDASGVTDLAFSPDGRLLAIVSGFQTYLLNLDNWERTLLGDSTYPALSVTFSPDGKFIATVMVQYSGDGAAPIVPLHLWDTKTGSYLAGIEAGNDDFDTVAFGIDNSLIVNDRNNHTFIWHVEDLLKAWKTDSHEEWFGSYADANGVIQQTLPGGDFFTLGPDRKTLAIVNNSTIQLMDAQSGGQRTQFQLPGFDALESNRVGAIAFSPTQLLVAFSSGTAVRLVNTETGMPEQVLTGDSRVVMSLLFSKDGKKLFSGSGAESFDNGGTRIWDVETGKLLVDLGDIDAPVMYLQLSADGRILSTASHLGGVLGYFQLWDWAAQKHIDPVAETIASIAFSPKDPLALIVIADNSTKQSRALVWDYEHKTQVTLLEGDSDHIGNPFFTPDGGVVVIPAEGKFQFWDVRAGHLLTTTGSGDEPVFSLDGKLLAYTDNEGIIIHNMESGAEHHIPVQIDYISLLSFSADGSLIFYGSNLWNAQTGELSSTLDSGTPLYTPYSDIYAISAVKADGKMIAFTDGGGVRLWGVPAAAS